METPKFWFILMIVVGFVGLADPSLLANFKGVWIVPAVVGMMMSLYYTSKTMLSMFK